MLTGIDGSALTTHRRLVVICLLLNQCHGTAVARYVAVASGNFKNFLSPDMLFLFTNVINVSGKCDLTHCFCFISK